jgi:hypothetical protein
MAQRILKKMRALKKEILKDEELEKEIKQVYCKRVNEIIANAQMSLQAAIGNQKNFNRYNKFNHGEPKEEVFKATSNYFYETASKALNSGTPKVKEAAQIVLELIEKDENTTMTILPSQELFDAVKTGHEEFKNKILRGLENEIPAKGFKNAVEADPFTRRILNNIGLHDVKIVDQKNNGTTWSFSAAKKELYRPRTNKPISKERYIGLVAFHEIGTHGLEVINGKNSDLPLLAMGLDRYVGASEGKATIREQIAYDTAAGLAEDVRFQDILRRHFAISLAFGHQNGPKDFKEAYKIINAIDRLWERQNKEEEETYEDADKKADKRTWALLTERTHKGTDGTHGAYRKDMIYLENNIAYWQLAKREPESMKYWDLGKFDYNNKEHVKVLQKLGMIPIEK